MKKFTYLFILCAVILILQACGNKEDAAPELQYEVTTLAGGTQGFSDGKGSAAKFNIPQGIAVDAGGNVYVADIGNNCIRKITPDGTVSTFVGGDIGYADGTGTAAKFRLPRDLVIDNSGTMYVADNGNYKIRKVTPDGVVTTIAGLGAPAGFQDGPASTAKFNGPVALTTNGNGSVYVADSYKVRIISPTGQVTTLAGTTPGFADGPASSAQLSLMDHLMIDGGGNVLVADLNNHRIRKIATDGTVSTLSGGVAGYKDGEMALALFNSPRGIVMANDLIYITEGSNGTVGAGPAGLDARIRTINLVDGSVRTIAGGSAGFKDGIGSEAQFFAPESIAIDANGIIYISDSKNYAIRKIVVK